MDMAMTIEEFNALLTSEEAKKDSNPLLAALCKLTTIEKPEDITRLAEEASQSWSDWNAPPP